MTQKTKANFPLRIMALLTAILIAFTLSACGENETPKTDEELIEERVNTFLTAYNDGDMEAVMECLDAKTRNAFEAMMNLVGGIAGSLIGFDIDLSDLFSLGIHTASGDFMGLEITDISVDGASAIATTKMDLTGAADNMTIYFYMVYEHDGWYIHDMNDKLASSSGTGNSGTGNSGTGNSGTSSSGTDSNGAGDSQGSSQTTYAISTYCYSLDYGNAGSYTEINGKYPQGEKITLKATVNDGYNFDGWFIGDTCLSDELEFTYTVGSRMASIEAVFSKYTVRTYSDSDEYNTAGSYTLINKAFSIGKTVSVEATTNEGYNFEGWYRNGIFVTASPSYSFTMTAEDVYLEAVWSYYTVSTESRSDEQGTAGSYTRLAGEKITAGETVTLTATVNEGFNFEGWYVDDVCVCKDLEYRFVMEKEDRTVRAEYSYYTFTSYGVLDKWGCSQIEDSIGTCTTYDNQKISNGETVELTATVCDGYTFIGWFIDDICVSTDYAYTYNMSKESVEIIAKYTYYTLSVWAFDRTSYSDYRSDDIATVTFYDDVKIQVGETVTLSAYAKNGYRFIGWEHNGIIVSTNNTYTFTMEDCDDSFVAIFEEI